MSLYDSITSITDDVLEMEADWQSNSSRSVSSTSSDWVSCQSEVTSIKLYGNDQANDLLQLMTDNHVRAVVLESTKQVANKVNHTHLFFQNCFLSHLAEKVLPQIIASLSASSVSASTSTNATTITLPSTSVDIKMFVEGLEKFVQSAERFPIKVGLEARAIKSIMARVNDDVSDKGFPVHVVSGVKIKILRLQRDFINYLKEVDGPMRINSLKSTQ